MAPYGRLLTDAQWEKNPALTSQTARALARWAASGRRLQVVEGLLWILRSGARRQDLPDEFPHRQPATGGCGIGGSKGSGCRSGRRIRSATQTT